MDATGGHVGVLSIPTHVGRKEWRVVSEGSGRERVAGDSFNDEGRLNGSGRTRANPGAVRQNSRNSRIFHSGNSGTSNDSDYHTTDFVGSLVIGTSVSRQEFTHQSTSEDDDTRHYEDITRVQQEEHSDPTMNPLSLDTRGLSSPENPEDVLQQRLHEIIRQREQLQIIELELRAQFIASSEVLRLQNGFDEQAKQHAGIVANLQDEVQERDHRIHDLEQQLEERGRELHANQLEANEAVSQVWAKDDLLREQTGEIGNMRRERDNAVADHKAAVAQIEAERAQTLSQLQDLKEQVQQKEHQVQEIEEQRRSTQDALIYKDDQLREAQAWMQRAQELDAFHANANSSLHAELRDRTEQMNQLWLGYQRQLSDAERYHAQALQKLQLEVTELREQNRLLRSATSIDRIETKDDRTSRQDSKDIGRFNDQSATANSKMTTTGVTVNNHVKSGVYLNGTVDGGRSIVIQRETPPKVEHATGLPVGANPVLGMAHIPPSGPAAIIHQLQQSIVPSLQPIPVQNPQPPMGPFQPVQTVIQTQYVSGTQQTIQHRPNQSQQHHASQAQRLSQRHHHYHANNQSNAKMQLSPQTNSTEHNQLQTQNDRGQMAQEHPGAQRQQVMHLSQHSDSPDIQRPNAQQLGHQLQHVASQAHHHQQHHFTEQQVATSSQLQELRLEEPTQGTSTQLPHSLEVDQQQQEGSAQHHERNKRLSNDQVQMLVQQSTPHSLSQQQSKQQKPQVQPLQDDIDLKSQPFQLIGSSSGEQLSTGHQTPASAVVTVNHESSDGCQLGGKQSPDSQELQNSSVQPVQHLNVVDGGGKGTEPLLLDERSLLACLVRVIPAESSSRIRISTTLPNRLGKMLAPLHWHDYKKQYGRLDDFVNSHQEIFAVEGDFIYLREGAHALVSATTAVAKAAAAAVAAASPIGPNWSPPVAVTPVAQSHMQRFRNSKGKILAQKEDNKYGPGPSAVQNNAQSTHSQQANGLPLQQGNGNPQSMEGPTMRSAVGDERVYTCEKVEGQGVTTVLGLGPNGVASNANTLNGGEFQKTMTNGFGDSGSVSERNGSYYGNRQLGRTAILPSGPFGKQDLINRPQTQESRISRSSATAAH